MEIVCTNKDNNGPEQAIEKTYENKERKGGVWSWVNFKYERLSTFCFVFGLIGHSERDCNLVYANPDKEIARAYGVWLRAPTRNSSNQNVGAKWLRNGAEGSQPRERHGYKRWQKPP